MEKLTLANRLSIRIMAVVVPYPEKHEAAEAVCNSC